MDIQRPKRKFHEKYRYHILAAVLFLMLVIYAIVISFGASKQKIDFETLRVEDVKRDKFMEYVDVEGVIQPILTIQVNTKEAGNVEQVVAENGKMLKAGDTILVLNNPDLIREIEDERDSWHNKNMQYKEREIEMEQKTLNLRQQTLETNYELNRLKKNFKLDEEEYRMGVKSKAQLEVSKDEYDYKLKKTALQLENLQHDSVVTTIRKQMIKEDMEREEKKYNRTLKRLDDLVVRAPIDGQVSFVDLTPGQSVPVGRSIGEIKVMDQFKVHASISEFYIDRIVNDLPATITYQSKKFPLSVTKVVPEVTNRAFPIDLVFDDVMPDNVRIGKSYRVQIELGQSEEAIVIPKGNFFQFTGGQWIFKVVDDGKRAVKQSIVIGRQNPLQYEVLDGLKSGDKVIVTGYDGFGDVEELIIKK